MPDPILSALAGSSPVGAAGPAPLSPVPSPEMGISAPQQESEEEQASATLGELAMAFKEASTPSDAAAILLEFMTTAGFSRG